MLRSFLLNWFASQYGNEIRAKVQETAKEVIRESAGLIDGTEETEEFGRADVGFLFTAGKEYGCFTDLLKNCRVTKGNGLKFTQAHYKGLKIAIVETGSGAEAVREGVLALIQVFQPVRVISAGYAAALKPEIKRNRLFMPLDLLSGKDGRRLDLRQKFLTEETGSADVPDKDNEKKTGSGNTDPFDRLFGTGVLLTLDTLPADSNERRALAKKYGADLADSSTYFAAEICREQSVPFLAVRVAAVSFDEERAADLRNITEPENQSAARLLGALWGAVSKRPGSFLELCKVKENELTAADTLAEGLISILDAE